MFTALFTPAAAISTIHQAFLASDRVLEESKTLWKKAPNPCGGVMLQV